MRSLYRVAVLGLATLCLSTNVNARDLMGFDPLGGRITVTIYDEEGDLVAFATDPGQPGPLLFFSGPFMPIHQSLNGLPYLESWWERNGSYLTTQVTRLPWDNFGDMVLRNEQTFAQMEAAGWDNVAPPYQFALFGPNSQTLEAKFEKYIYDEDTGRRIDTKRTTLKTPRKPGESAAKHVARHEEELAALEDAGWVNVGDWTPDAGTGGDDDSAYVPLALPIFVEDLRKAA